MQSPGRRLVGADADYLNRLTAPVQRVEDRLQIGPAARGEDDDSKRAHIAHPLLLQGKLFIAAAYLLSTQISDRYSPFPSGSWEQPEEKVKHLFRAGVGRLPLPARG